MVHATLWAGENCSRIAGAGRSHGVDTERCVFCIAEIDKVDIKAAVPPAAHPVLRITMDVWN